SPALAAALAALAAAAFVVVGVASNQRSIVSLAGENRPRYWHVAWHEYEDNPVLGSGAGTFDEYWLQYRTVPSFARDAHSLYIESLAELGPLGLGLVVAALGLPLLALRRDLDPVGAAAAAGYVAYLIHTGLEWDWELPAVTLAGLLCGTALLVATRDGSARELSTPTRLALLAAALAFAALTLMPKTATNPAGSQHCVTATVQDAFTDPVEGVTVRFTVSGSDSVSGSRTTDANGQATFCYTVSAFPGADAIHAFADTNDNGAQ